VTRLPRPGLRGQNLGAEGAIMWVLHHPSFDGAVMEQNQPAPSSYRRSHRMMEQAVLHQPARDGAPMAQMEHKTACKTLNPPRRLELEVRGTMPPVVWWQGGPQRCVADLAAPAHCYYFTSRRRWRRPMPAPRRRLVGLGDQQCELILDKAFALHPAHRPFFLRAVVDELLLEVSPTLSHVESVCQHVRAEMWARGHKYK
jgi:hypothetical protein